MFNVIALLCFFLAILIHNKSSTNANKNLKQISGMKDCSCRFVKSVGQTEMGFLINRYLFCINYGED